MKRIISFMTALALIGCQPCGMINCAETASLSQSAASGEILIALEKNITAANGMFTVTYDADKITPENIELNAALDKTLTAVNTSLPGKIIIGFAASEPVTVSDYIADITFKCSDYCMSLTGICTLSVDELVTLDESKAEANVSADGIILSEVFTEPYASVSNETSDEQGHLPVYIDIERNSAFTNGIFTVKYDPEILAFNGGSSADIMENTMYEINENEPGTIKIAFISSKPVTDTGHAFLLDFTGKKNDQTVIELTADEFSYMAENGETKADFSGSTSGSVVTVQMQEKTISIGSSAENTASVFLDEKTNATNGVFTVKYDADCVKFEKSELCSGFSDVIAEVNETEPGTLKIAFVTDKKLEAGGEFIKLHFTRMLPGICAVSIDVNEFSEITSSGETRDIPYSLKSGSIEDEKEPEYDINSDGSVTAADIITMTKCILTPESVSADVLKNADLNGNGVVNVFDMIRLQRYLVSL